MMDPVLFVGKSALPPFNYDIEKMVLTNTAAFLYI